MRKYVVTFHLQGGTKIKVKCDAFEMSRLSPSGARSFTLTNSDKVWSVDVDKVEGYTVTRCWFDTILLPL